MDVKGQSPIFIKFQSKEIIDSLQSGIVYLNELGIFQKMEEQEDNHETGDRMENRIISEAYELPGGTSCKFIITEEGRCNYVFCLFCIPAGIECFRFNDEQKEKLSHFGDTALVIYDSQEFIRRVAETAEGAGHELHDREVIYYDEKDEMPKEQMDFLTKGLYHFSFFKRQKYRYQQEYRLALNMEKSSRDHIELDIKDIKNISFQTSTQQLLGEGIDMQN